MSFNNADGIIIMNIGSHRVLSGRGGLRPVVQIKHLFMAMVLIVQYRVAGVQRQAYSPGLDIMTVKNIYVNIG
jgi:hypothetical protein